MDEKTLHVMAAKGFERAATVYEQARPSYPMETIEFIGSLCHEPKIVIDLGAGTGKLTRLLGSIGAQKIIAIEPVASMRENLKTIPFIAQIIDATADRIPFDDHTVDMIVCGQSFHWFANHRTLIELNRVLKSDGFLVLVWNSVNHSGQEWAQNLSQFVDSFQSNDTPRYSTMIWKQVFDNQQLFSSLNYKQFGNNHRVTRELFINRILSTSFIASLSDEKQTYIVEQIRKMLNNADEIRDLNEFDLPYLTHIYWCSPIKTL